MRPIIYQTCACKYTQVFAMINRKVISDKWICEYTELIDKNRCDRGFIWNLKTCGCECDKSCISSE